MPKKAHHQFALSAKQLLGAEKARRGAAQLKTSLMFKDLGR
jgi:hypothetical protein